MRHLKILFVAAVLASPVLASLGCTTEHTTETKKGLLGGETKTDTTTVKGNN